MDLPSPSSALSPSVQRLICCTGVVNFRDEPSLLPGCLLDWDHLARMLPLAEDTSTYFEKAVSALAPIFTQCQHGMVNTPLSQLLVDFQHHLSWTSSPKVLIDCLEMLKREENSAQQVLVFLLTSATLERSLGNVYLSRGTQCPSMLKDLLVTPELTDMLGSTVMETLRVLIGPPISLNLRNVAWHGFFADGELSCRYCCFLLAVTASIGKILSERGMDSKDIPQRPLLTWTEPVSTLLFQEPTLQCVHKKRLDSPLAQPQTQGQWRLAFRLYGEGRYGFCLALILPLLEHVLRRLFAALNGCPERVLTAESSALYTTFNEMLEQSLPDGQLNQLPVFLGTSCMDLLLDLLFYPDGPRVRDRLSHGEVDFANVDRHVVDPFISVAVFLADRVTTSHSSQSDLIREDPDLKAVVSTVENYRSKFHPIAILQQKLSDFLAPLASCDSCVIFSPDLEPLGDATQQTATANALLLTTQGAVSDLWKCDKWKDFTGVHVTSIHHCFKTQCDAFQQSIQHHIPTLFRWQSNAKAAPSSLMRESEFVGLLLRITEECATAVEQIQQALQLRQEQLLAKELRSRQRENLKKLLLSVPCIEILLCTVAAILTKHLQLIPTFSSLQPSACKLLQKHLKTVLQHSENVRTYTSAEKNKWTEAVDLLINLLPKLQQFVIQWIGS